MYLLSKENNRVYSCSILWLNADVQMYSCQCHLHSYGNIHCVLTNCNIFLNIHWLLSDCPHGHNVFLTHLTAHKHSAHTAQSAPLHHFAIFWQYLHLALFWSILCNQSLCVPTWPTWRCFLFYLHTRVTDERTQNHYAHCYIVTVIPCI